MNSTPLESVGQIFFKREDRNPTGSLKDRGIPLQIEQAVNKGQHHFVISSSGNAAISAANYCFEHHLSLDIFISPTTASSKKSRLLELKNQNNIQLHEHTQPLTESIRFANERKLYHLRQGTDPHAPVGYHEIAFELFEQLLHKQKLSSIFIPVSSGTATVGIYQGIQQLIKEKKLAVPVQIHIAQTAAIHPIAGLFDTDFRRKSTSIADAIVPPLDPPRRHEVIDIVQQTNGSGWVPGDAEIQKALDWLSQNGIKTSAEGGLALAAYWKAMEKGHDLPNPIILLTGAVREQNSTKG